MNKRKLFRECVISAGRGELSPVFSRYIILINNYLKGKTISEVEPINYQHNPPRKYYIEKISTGFNIDIDWDSPLFEGRINKTYFDTFEGVCANIERFFERVQLFEEHNMPFQVKDLTIGSIWFLDKYGKHFIESTVPLTSIGNKVRLLEKPVVLNIIKAMKEEKVAFYVNKIDILIKYYELYVDKEVRLAAYDALKEIYNTTESNKNKLDIFFSLYQPIS